MVVGAGVGMVSGAVGTVGIKAVFAIKNYQKKHAQHPAPPPAPQAAAPAAAAAAAPAAPAAPHPPPPPPSRETWEQHGFGPAIVGAEFVGGFTGRWPALSEMGKLGNIMTWATGIGYGLVYGVAITPWIQTPIIVPLILFFALVMVADYGLLVPWGIFKPPWKEGHSFYFNLELYGVYCVITVVVFWALSQLL
jgi:hypothetical protein